jgi:UDPglucose 6-dehydrogenase/GDP-mannose 6-dehydrogenase
LSNKHGREKHMDSAHVTPLNVAPLTAPPLTVAIIGTGYVGLVTGACLAASGHRVTCVDRDSGRVAALAAGETPIHEEGLPDLLRQGRERGLLAATTQTHDAVKDADVVLIAVGTPLRDGTIDLQAVAAATCEVGRALRHHDGYPVVAIKSTVVPGTTEGMVRSILEHEAGRKVGDRLGLAVNPEFLSQGSAVRDFLAADRIIIGQADQRSGDVMAALYHSTPAPVLRLTLTEAEMAKYAANALQAMLISFANQIAGLCEALPGADHRAVMRATHLDRMLAGPDGSRAGATAFLMGGIGFGGSCFPKDLAALSSWAWERGVEVPLVDATLTINARRPRQVVDLLTTQTGPLAGKRIAVLGLAFKPGTDDLRESPALSLLRLLATSGAVGIGHDPLPEVRDNARRLHAVEVAETAAEALSGADGAIIATAWPEYRDLDWSRMATLMRHPVVIDGRFLLSGLALPAGLHVVPVGTRAR